MGLRIRFTGHMDQIIMTHVNNSDDKKHGFVSATTEINKRYGVTYSVKQIIARYYNIRRLGIDGVSKVSDQVVHNMVKEKDRRMKKLEFKVEQRRPDAKQKAMAEAQNKQYAEDPKQEESGIMDSQLGDSSYVLKYLKKEKTFLLVNELIDELNDRHLEFLFQRLAGIMSLKKQG